MTIDWLKITNYFYFSRKNLAEISLYLLSFFYVKIYLIIILILNSFNWLFVYSLSSVIDQDLVILYYNVNLGINLIGDVSQIYIIPLLGLIFILFNLILLINVYKYGKFIIHLLLILSTVTNFIFLISTAVLYLINFR
ncbi:MAG: hypothetical protein ABH818_02005 [Patescibacteria group bacterium]